MNTTARIPSVKRKRMSIEHLARCHVAMMGHGSQALAARAECTKEELSGLVFGSSFLGTLLCSGAFLDLYEETAHVGEVRRSSPVEAAARAENRKNKNMGELIKTLDNTGYQIESTEPEANRRENFRGIGATIITVTPTSKPSCSGSGEGAPL